MGTELDGARVLLGSLAGSGEWGRDERKGSSALDASGRMRTPISCEAKRTHSASSSSRAPSLALPALLPLMLLHPSLREGRHPTYLFIPFCAAQTHTLHLVLLFAYDDPAFYVQLSRGFLYHSFSRTPTLASSFAPCSAPKIPISTSTKICPISMLKIVESRSTVPNVYSYTCPCPCPSC
jgi:hypothetical protein